MAGKHGMKKDNSNRWELAIRLSLSGVTWKEIAEKMKVEPNTIWYWRQDPKFQKMLSEAQDLVLREVASNHARYLSAAFEVESRIMNDDSNSPAIRLSAAEILAKQVLDAVEIHNMVKANQQTLQTLEDMTKRKEELSEDA